MNDSLISRVDKSAWATTPAASKGPLAAVTLQQLLDLRYQGKTNTDLTRIFKTTNNGIVKAIGMQPPKEVMQKYYMDYCFKLAQQKSIQPVPERKLAHRFTIEKGKLHVTVDFDASNIRINPTASNWITMGFSDIDDLINALYDVLDKLQKEGVTPDEK